MKWLINPFIARVISALKNVDSNIHIIAKRAGVSWQQARGAIHILYLYDLITVSGNKPKIFTLTQDGKSIKEYVHKINLILNTARTQFICKNFGYDDRDTFLEEIKEDLE